MRFTPHPFQMAAIDYAATWHSTAKRGDKLLLASPTGTGKSVMELATQAAIAGSWIVTPVVEVVGGLLHKLGHEVDGLPEDRLRALAWSHRITTPIVLRNRLLRGEIPAPAAVIFDEAHHHTAETYQLLELLTGSAPAIGFTATPYRGTPRSTARFRAAWGEPVWVVTLREAVDLGALSFPSFRVEPLVDDDTVEVVNGEFSVTSIDSATGDKVEDFAQLVASFGLDRPSMVAAPSRATARLVADAIGRHVPAEVVDGDTPHAERQRIFADTVAARCVLVQIRVVGEGVDLPIRRLYDLSPMLSPVLWLQTLGRITRPVRHGEASPEYVGCNRNLLRHAYLLDGCLPPEALVDAQAAFVTPSSRLAVRAIGLEGVGRFAAVEVPFSDGVVGACYSVSSVDGSTVTQFTCLVHPGRESPLWASRRNERTDDPRKPVYGRWRRCDAPADLTGFASVPPAPLSEKQAAWWKRDAARYGLDPAAKVTRKNFAALPVLSDLRCKL